MFKKSTAFLALVLLRSKVKKTYLISLHSQMCHNSIMVQTFASRFAWFSFWDVIISQLHSCMQQGRAYPFQGVVHTVYVKSRNGTIKQHKKQTFLSATWLTSPVRNGRKPTCENPYTTATEHLVLMALFSQIDFWFQCFYFFGMDSAEQRL